MSFLKAEWRKLILLNYEVDSNILLNYIPHNTELELWKGTCYLSLVGFMFKNTRLLGLKIPFHVNFEEVNLRFYVRHRANNEWRRGVVFIKEIVPKRSLTFVANTIYQENYETRSMRHDWQELENSRMIKYEWKNRNVWNFFSVESAKEAVKIVPGSETEFITEHYWGYTKIDERKTFEYEVTHPKWQVYPVKDFKLFVDFKSNYGNQFQGLDSYEPKSVMLAEGSAIKVESKRKI